MRRLWRFSLLCVGAAALVACWLLAFALAAGLILRAVAWWWLLPGAGGGLFLVAAGRWLIDRFSLEVEGPESAVITGTAGLVAYVAVPALIVASLTVVESGPELYHERFGERAEAVVTAVEGDRYRVAGHGWLERGPGTPARAGDRVEVSVDPHGRVAPVAADSLGSSRLPAVLLVCCLGAVVLAALGVVATALLEWLFAS